MKGNRGSLILLVLAACGLIALMRFDVYARGPIHLRDTQGNRIPAGSNIPYSPKQTCAGGTSDVVQFFGSPSVMGNTGCHVATINRYGLSNDRGVCRRFDWSTPGYVTVAGATNMEACNGAGGTWFPELTALYESGVAYATKDHGSGAPPYSVPYARHGVSAGYHFQQGRSVSWGGDQRNYYGLQNFTSSPGMYGKYCPSTNRQLADLNASLSSLDMSSYDFATSGCSWCHPGGGAMEYDREGYRYDGVAGLFQGGPNPNPKAGDYFSFDPQSGAIVSKVSAWQAGGAAEVDCLICHTMCGYGPYTLLERNFGLSEGKAPGMAASLALAAPDGLTGFLRIPGIGGDGINPDVGTMSWNEQSWWYSWLYDDYLTGVYMCDASPVPHKESCAQCHFADRSLTNPGPTGKPLGLSTFQKILQPGTADDGDKTVPGGRNDVVWKSFRGRADSDRTGESINDANNPDAHMDKGVNCSTCHYLLGSRPGNYVEACGLCHPDFYNPPTNFSPAVAQVFPPVTDQSGNVVIPPAEVLRIDHQFARGNSGTNGTNMDNFTNTVTCESCHIERSHPNAGNAPNPAVAHSGFPSFHFENIACKTCHIPVLNGPMRQVLVDFTAGQYQAFDRVQTIENEAGIGYVPLRVWMARERNGGRMQIQPVALTTTALWADRQVDGSLVPVFRRTVQAAAEALRSSYGSGGGMFNWTLNSPQNGDVTLIINKQSEIADMVARLKLLGVSEPVMNFSVRPFTVSHNIAPRASGKILGSPAGGGCVMCHSSSDPASRNFDPRSVGFFEGQHLLFVQPADGGAGIVQTTSDGLKRVNLAVTFADRANRPLAFDLSANDGQTVNNTISQAALFGFDAARLDLLKNPETVGMIRPAARFSFVPDPVVSLKVNFDGSRSLNADTYSWNFGDGAVSSGPVVSHTYGEPGTYTVTLTVTNSSSGLKDTLSIPVVPVVRIPEPTVDSIAVNKAGYVLTLTLNGLSSSVTRVYVNWQDGVMSNYAVSGGTLPPLTHDYAATTGSGSYYVSVIVADAKNNRNSYGVDGDNNGVNGIQPIIIP